MQDTHSLQACNAHDHAARQGQPEHGESADPSRCAALDLELIDRIERNHERSSPGAKLEPVGEHLETARMTLAMERPENRNRAFHPTHGRPVSAPPHRGGHLFGLRVSRYARVCAGG